MVLHVNAEVQDDFEVLRSHTVTILIKVLMTDCIFWFASMFRGRNKTNDKHSDNQFCDNLRRTGMLSIHLFLF